MKAKVLISFIDQKNKVTQPVGKIIDLSKARYEEIVAANDKLVEVVDKNEVGQDPADAGSNTAE